MAEKNPNDPTDAQIREAASESVRQGTDIRAQVHEITLRALQSRRFDRSGIREVVRAVTEGTALGAERKHTGMRQAMSEALSGLDQALRTSAEAGQQALKELTSSGRSFSDTELKQVLANLRRLEKDFLDTAGQVADSANEAVRPELREAVRNVGRAGTATGKQVALTMGEFAQKFGAASFEATLTGLETAADFGQRFTLIASGILTGMAEALRTESKPESSEPRRP
jgi:type VI protein secretion system component VasK